MSRLPRFKRILPIASIQLTQRDHEIIRLIHRHRFLRSHQIVTLVGGSPQQLVRRLQLLYHHGYRVGNRWSFAIIWIVGINIGLGLTSLFVSRTNLEGRRLGLANLLAKLFVAMLILLLVPRRLFSDMALSLPVPQQLAFMHTAFNVICGVSCPALAWLAVTGQYKIRFPRNRQTGTGIGKSKIPERHNLYRLGAWPAQ